MTLCVWVRAESVLSVGAVVKAKLRGRIIVDRATDPEYYPPEDADQELVARYFITMVAMDHRASRSGRPYEAYVDGRLYHGADLLYKLGSKMLAENPDFFDPLRLANLGVEDVLAWLTPPGGPAPPDPDVRAELLRDLGSKLVKLYEGRVLRLLTLSKGRLKTRLHDGLIDRLKVFKAYSDPVEKKAFLLAKFLHRRGLFEAEDREHREVPVDNHLTRIALRLGLVAVPRETEVAIARGVEFDSEEDLVMRLAVRRSYKLLAESSGIDPFDLDDFLWAFGRKCCTREAPVCVSGCTNGCAKVLGCDGGSCVFSEVCPAAGDPRRLLPEHRHEGTWYY